MYLRTNTYIYKALRQFARRNITIRCRDGRRKRTLPWRDGVFINFTVIEWDTRVLASRSLSRSSRMTLSRSHTNTLTLLLTRFVYPGQLILRRVVKARSHSPIYYLIFVCLFVCCDRVNCRRSVTSHCDCCCIMKKLRFHFSNERANRF